MATIGTIASNVIMRTAPFEAGARKVVSATKSMGAQAGASGGGFGMLGGAIGRLAAPAAIAATAFAAIRKGINEVTEAMTRIDETAATASNLGIQIDKFVAYQHAANKAEVGSAEFVVAIKKLENAAADAADGTGNAAKHFDKLGISAEKFKALSPDQQLAVIADKLQGVTNQAERAQIATDLFGKSGMGMLGFLKDGAAGLAEAEARAKMLGITLTDLDAAKVDAANDALDDMAGVFDGLWNQMAVALAPAIQDAAESMTGWLVENMPLVKDLISMMGKLASAVVEVGKGFVMVWEKLSPIWQAVKQAHGLFGNTGTQLGGGKSAALPDVAKGPNDPLTKELKAQGAKLFESMKTPSEQFASKMEDYNNLLKVGAINQDTYGRAVKAAQDELDKSNEFKFDKPQVDLTNPRLGSTASSPAALQRGSSEAFNAYLQNQRGQEGDPVVKVMKDIHAEQVAKLEAIREAVRQSSAKGAIF